MSAARAIITYEHIARAADGTPFIDGTTMKVVELVMAR